MKEEDISRLVYSDSRIFRLSEERIKSAILLMQGLGVEGEKLSKLLAKQPRLLSYSKERVIESFKQAESFGLKKG